MDFIEFIKIATLFLLLFFSFFLFLNNKKNKMPAILLGLVFSFHALEMLNATFYRYFDYWSLDFPWVFYSTEITFFLVGPAIYFFFLKTIQPQRKNCKQDLLHLLPAIIHTFFLVFTFHLYGNNAKTEMLQTGVMTASEDFVIHLMRNTSMVFYLVLSALLLLNKKMTQNYSYKWMLFFLIVFSIVELIQIFYFFDLFNRDYNKAIYNTTSIFWFLLVIIMLYKALQNSLFFVNHEPVVSNQKKEPSVPLLSDDEKQILVSKIKKVVNDEKAYLDPDLSLVKLATELASNSNKVSFVINEHFKLNFSDYINSHRVSLAKEILLNPKSKDRTVLEIGYEVGFNSKATFNRAFTKFADSTPSQYRKSHQL